MKTFRLAAIALASGLALGGTAALAQPTAPAAAEAPAVTAQGKAAGEARGPSQHRAAAHRAESRQDGKRWAHGDRGPRHAWRALDLTDEQKDKMFSLRHAAAPELRNLMKEARGYERDLQDMVRGGKFDESAARELAKGSSDARAKLLVLRAKLQADTMALFTPEQRAKAERMHARAGQHHPGGRQGPGGAGDAPRPMR